MQERGPDARRDVVHHGRGTMEGAQEHALAHLHLEQDQRYVLADVRVRQEIRPSPVQTAREGEGNGDEGVAHQIHQRRDRELHLRGERGLDKGAQERVLHVRQSGRHFDRVEEEFQDTRAQEHALAGQLAQAQHIGEAHSEIFHRSRGGDGRGEGTERDDELGSDPTDDGYEEQEGIG